MTYFCPTTNLSTVCRTFKSTKQAQLVGKSQPIKAAKKLTPNEMLTESLRQEGLIRRMERHPLPKRMGPGRSPLVEARAQQLETIDTLFPNASAAHKDQVGLFMLTDRLLQKEEMRRSIREGTLITAEAEQKPFLTHPQKLLQKINRLLQESDQISINIKVRAPRKSSPYCFVVGMIGLAERILRFPLRHHTSVVLAAKELLDQYGALRALIADHMERACNVKKSGTKGFSAQRSLDEVERDEELLGSYTAFSGSWRRFTYLLFKERAYQLIQVDEAEIANLMETTSRLSA